MITFVAISLLLVVGNFFNVQYRISLPPKTEIIYQEDPMIKSNHYHLPGYNHDISTDKEYEHER
jgi:hypothetical protein